MGIHHDRYMFERPQNYCFAPAATFTAVWCSRLFFSRSCLVVCIFLLGYVNGEHGDVATGIFFRHDICVYDCGVDPLEKCLAGLKALFDHSDLDRQLGIIGRVAHG